MNREPNTRMLSGTYFIINALKFHSRNRPLCSSSIELVNSPPFYTFYFIPLSFFQLGINFSFHRSALQIGRLPRFGIIDLGMEAIPCKRSWFRTFQDSIDAFYGGCCKLRSEEWIQICRAKYSPPFPGLQDYRHAINADERKRTLPELRWCALG